MKKLIAWLFIAATSALAQSVQPGDVFISPIGNDSNPCTLSLPCATPQHAAIVFRTAPATAQHIWLLSTTANNDGVFLMTQPLVLTAADSGNANGHSSLTWSTYEPTGKVFGGISQAHIWGARELAHTFTIDVSGTYTCAGPCTIYKQTYSPSNGNIKALWFTTNSAATGGYATGFMRRKRPQHMSVTATGAGWSPSNGCQNSTSAPQCVSGVSGGMSGQAIADSQCGIRTFPAWSANASDAGGTMITDSNGNLEEAIVGGTTGATQPTWTSQVPGARTIDGTVTWLQFPSAHVAYQSDPCNHNGSTTKPWMCFNQFYYSGSAFASISHALAIGDVDLLEIERWTVSRLPMTAINTSTKQVTLNGSAAFNGNGNSGCIPQHPYLAENDVEDLHAGEWYLDRCPTTPNCTTPDASWILYFAADTSMGENPNTGTVAVSGMPLPYGPLIRGNGVQSVTFFGIDFGFDAWSPPTVGLPGSQGQPYMPAAISFMNSSNVVFDSDQFAHIAGWGVEFLGPGSGNQVVNSNFFDLGGPLVRFGQHGYPGDTDANVEQYDVASNNRGLYYNETDFSGEGTGIYLGDVHHNTVTFNTVGQAPGGGAMNICDWLNRGLVNGGTGPPNYFLGFCHDNVVTNNDLSGLKGNGALTSTLTSDTGLLYGDYGLSSVCPALPAPCNKLLNNYLHDFGSNNEITDTAANKGIYMDQGSSDVLAQGNVVARIAGICGYVGPPSHGAADGYAESEWIPTNDIIMGNVFAGCGSTQSNDAAVIIRNGLNRNSFTFTGNVVLIDSAVAGETMQHFPGNWPCIDQDPMSPTYGVQLDCIDFYNFNGNQYFDLFSGGSPDFYQCQSTNCNNANLYNVYTGLGWSWMGDEDSPGGTNPSAIFNPQLSITYGIENWMPLAASVKISGFTVWPYQTETGVNGIGAPGNNQYPTFTPTQTNMFPMVGESLITDFFPQALPISLGYVPQHYNFLSWPASGLSNIVAYNIYRATSSGGPYSKVNPQRIPAGTTGLTYADNNSVTFGTTYYYKETSINSSGGESSQTADVTIVGSF